MSKELQDRDSVLRFCEDRYFDPVGIGRRGVGGWTLRMAYQDGFRDGWKERASWERNAKQPDVQPDLAADLMERLKKRLGDGPLFPFSTVSVTETDEKLSVWADIAIRWVGAVGTGRRFFFAFHGDGDGLWRLEHEMVDQARKWLMTGKVTL